MMKVLILLLACSIAEVSLKPDFFNGYFNGRDNKKSSVMPAYNYPPPPPSFGPVSSYGPAPSYRPSRYDDDDTTTPEPTTLPPSSSEEITDIYSEENLMRNIGKLFRMKRKFFRGDKQFLGTILFDSVDKKCIRDKYIEYNFTRHIVEKLETSTPYYGYEPEKEEKDERLKTMDAKLSFDTFFFLCSKNLDLFLEFFFKNYMSFNVLYRHYINDPLLRNFTVYIPCFNKYALQNEISDFYGTKLPIAADNDEICLETSMLIKAAILATQIQVRAGTERVCSISIVEKAFNLFVRTLLMVQVELTTEQVKAEVEHLTQGVQEILTNSAECLTRGQQSRIHEEIFVLLTKY